MPDLVRVLFDGAVAGELADVRDIVDDHLQPCPAVRIHLGNSLLALDVRLVVSQQAVPGRGWGQE